MKRPLKPSPKDDFVQAVDRAGGPKAVRAAFDALRQAEERLGKDYSRILEEYSRHWIAMGPDGMIANVPVPEGSSEEDQEEALERLFKLIQESDGIRNGYLVRYIDSNGGGLIL